MANTAVNTNNIVFMAIEGHMKLTDNTWIADSGATCHITNLLSGMFDTKCIKESIKIGTGEETYATKCGKHCREIMTPEGKKEVILTSVCYVPGFYVKLFSLMAVMKNGAKLVSKGMNLTVENGPVKLEFTKCLETESSFVLGLKIKPKTYEFAGYTGKNRKINAVEWHGQLGHASDDIMRRTAAYYGKTVHKKFENCEDCAMGKSRQTNMNKETVERCQAGRKVIHRY